MSLPFSKKLKPFGNYARSNAIKSTGPPGQAASHSHTINNLGGSHIHTMPSTLQSNRQEIGSLFVEDGQLYIGHSTEETGTSGLVMGETIVTENLIAIENWDHLLSVIAKSLLNK